MSDRSYLSIGEVLSLLQPEFPDLTISKIRFLESQGLLEPERTPSGYRKFYETDVDRLRWILRQQREQYLPLKVIRGKLGDEVEPAPPTGIPPAPGEAASQPREERHEERSPMREQGRARGGEDQQEAPEGQERRRRPPPVAPPDSGPNPLVGPATGVSLTREELASAAGLDQQGLADLERYGLIAGRAVGATAYYDEESLAVATLAAGFMRHGVEARHLRMYKTAAERESGFFEQVVMPLLKQRNPRARREAVETLAELATLGQGLRAAMLRAALRDHLA